MSPSNVPIEIMKSTEIGTIGCLSDNLLKSLTKFQGTRPLTLKTDESKDLTEGLRRKIALRGLF